MAEGKSGSVWYYILILLIGAVLGTIFGGIVSQFVPKEGFIHDILTAGVNPSIGPKGIDLSFFKFNFDASINLTISTVLGIIVAALIMRKI